MTPLFQIATPLAHAGHDHTYLLGGQWHHILWLVVGATVVAWAGLAWKRAKK